MSFQRPGFNGVAKLWGGWRPPRATRKRVKRILHCRIVSLNMKVEQKRWGSRHITPRERLIIHSAISHWELSLAVRADALLEASRFMKQPVFSRHPSSCCASGRRLADELVESWKGQLGVPQVHRWTRWWTVACQRSPASQRLAVNPSSGTLWTNIHSRCLSLHASPLPRSFLIIQEMFQYALLPHPINNTLRLRQDFDGRRHLIMWVTVHPAALFKW